MGWLGKVWRRRWWLLGTIGCFLLLIGPWPDVCVRGWQALWWDSNDVPFETLEVVAVSEAAPFKVGTATCDFTDIGEQYHLPLAGYGKRAFTPPTGTADTVGGRVIVIQQADRKIAIVSLELLIVSRHLAERVLKELRRLNPEWKRKEIFFSATHTHSAPGGYGDKWAELPALGFAHHESCQMMSSRIAHAIHEASQASQPAEWATFAEEMPEDYIRNRTNYDDAANRWFDGIIFRSQEPGKKYLAALVTFSAHPTCRRSSDVRISGDYPGTLMATLSQRLDCPTLFLAGAVGSMAPAGSGVQREELAGWLGNRLASEATRAIEALPDEQWQANLQLGQVGGYVSLPPPRVKVSEDWRVSPIGASCLLPDRAWLQALRLGNVILVGTPADYSGNLAQELRDAVPNMRIVVTSFNGDYVGYILPDSYDPINRYEPRSMSLYGPPLGSHFQRSILELSHSLAEPAEDGSKSP